MDTLNIAILTGLKTMLLFALAWGTLWVLAFAWAKSDDEKHPGATATSFAFWVPVVIMFATVWAWPSDVKLEDVPPDKHAVALGIAWGLLVSSCLAYLVKHRFREPEPEEQPKKSRKS